LSFVFVQKRCRFAAAKAETTATPPGMVQQPNGRIVIKAPKAAGNRARLMFSFFELRWEAFPNPKFVKGTT